MASLAQHDCVCGSGPFREMCTWLEDCMWGKRGDLNIPGVVVCCMTTEDKVANDQVIEVGAHCLVIG